MAGSGQKWTERPLHVTQVILGHGQGIGQAIEIKLSGMADTSTVIVRMYRSFQSETNAVLNYAGAFNLEHGVSFARAA